MNSIKTIALLSVFFLAFMLFSNSAFAETYGKWINITNINTTDPIPANYSYVLSFNSSELISAGTLRANGTDLLVVCDLSGINTPIEWRNLTSMNDASINTTIAFGGGYNLSVLASSSNSLLCRLHYNNPSVADHSCANLISCPIEKIYKSPLTWEPYDNQTTGTDIDGWKIGLYDGGAGDIPIIVEYPSATDKSALFNVAEQTHLNISSQTAFTIEADFEYNGTGELSYMRVGYNHIDWYYAINPLTYGGYYSYYDTDYRNFTTPIQTGLGSHHWKFYFDAGTDTFDVWYWNASLYGTKIQNDGNERLERPFYDIIGWQGDTTGDWFWDNFIIHQSPHIEGDPILTLLAEKTITGPYYSDIIVTPASPQAYSVSGTEFNITWVNSTSDTSVDTAWMNANFSGSFINYYMTNYTADNYTYIINPGVGYFAYIFYANDTAGNTNSTGWYYHTINRKTITPILTVTPTWTVEINIEVNISCSADVNVTLKRDGNVVSNPYVAKLPHSIYSFNCTPEDSQNYTGYSSNYLNIISGGFGCTDNTIHAFQKNISSPDNLTTLNFTTLVSNNFVKANLSDVYINQSAYNITDVWENVTGGYYIIVNTSNTTSFVAEFGNYLGNESYSTHALGVNITNIINYDEQNAYYVLTFIDEISGESQLPPDSNISVTFLCSSGTSTFAVNDTQVLVPTFDSTLDELKATVSYPSDQYARTYIIDSAVEYKNIYLADAYQHTILQIPIYMSSYNYYDSRIKIYKSDVGNIYIITDGYFDVEHKFVTYLVKDEKYFIRIEQDSETRDVGFLVPATTAFQYLSIDTLTLYPDVRLISDNLLLAAEVDNATGSLIIQYIDLTNQTESVRIRAYEDVNQTAFFDNTYSGMSNITVTINGINSSRRYSVHFSIMHPEFGNSPVEEIIGAGIFGVFFDVGVASWLYPIFGFIMLLFTSFAAVPRIRIPALVFMLMMLGVLIYYQWFNLAAGTVVLLVIFVGVSVVYEIKKGGTV